ncbi:hypothetical protein [Reichenbachiella versicolor]|uniref:hypothetical protein n=1 Tax=Reichenbachiella versicolor TaxID=1821036 RepID=UPI000D6E592E|nr:hypothetical protein [Reichenbachiella versicolor]
MKINQLLFLGAILLLFSCSSEKKSEQVLMDEVIAIHDEVMPEMGTLHKLSGKLRQTADSLLVLDSATNTDVSKQLQDLSLTVELANESMMNWMREFEQPSEEMSHDDVMKYLQEQKTAISAVKANMITAKSDAEKALSRY